jgi:hypothetical protein
MAISSDWGLTHADFFIYYSLYNFRFYAPIHNSDSLTFKYMILDTESFFIFVLILKIHTFYVKFNSKC